MRHVRQNLTFSATDATCASRMFSYSALALVASLLTPGCQVFTHAPSAEPDPYDVYGAVLRETILAEGFGGPPRHESEHRPIDRLVIIDHTDPDGSFFEVSDYVRMEMPELDSTTVAAFATLERREPLERRFEGVGPYVLFTEQDRESIFPAGGWSEFYRRFPAAPGVIGLSGVGFGRGGTQALVGIMHVRDGLWGDWTFYLLELRAGAWNVIDRTTIAEA